MYARAAAAIYGLDRFRQAHWENLEQTLAVGVHAAQTLSTKQADDQLITASQSSHDTAEFFKQRPASLPDDPYLYPIDNR